ncbi:NusB antitermination factor [Spirosomataceae bacterium TFI 002]|nr:NusB antitermination factor [Spirosomataceae bacterium TFI 002]
MQSLYAYKQAKGANFQIAKDFIADHYLPDLNSMEYQDKEKLEGMKKLALSIFEDQNSIIPSEDEFETPSEMRLNLAQAQQLYTEKNKRDFSYYKLKALKEVDKVYEQYLTILQLFVLLAKEAEEDPKKNSKSHLGKNKILIELAKDEEFEHQLLKRSISFDEEPGFVKRFYKNALLVNNKYIEYCDRVNHTGDEEMAILKYMIKNIILKHEDSVNFLESENIYFTEDRETLRSMTVHTFTPYLEAKPVKVIDLDEEWQEKKDFLSTLFNDCIQDEAQLLRHIMPKLKNWDYDRIADTDKILLRMALVEMMEYETIPTKVTINEIIEISKSHSTPRSGQFINGVLDTLSKELVAQGIIKKSGRGMLDNK